jgi:exodeoxyribonuclease V alpha subunit
MFTVNRPDDGFVNGQTGEVVSIGLTTVVVFTEGREVEVSPYRWRYDSNDPGSAWFEQLPLRLANALTIHKSQGSEYHTVIIPVMSEHFVMLWRNLLYTAITRGKKLVVLVGQRKAIEIAVGNNSDIKRYSSLGAHLSCACDVL